MDELKQKGNWGINDLDRAEKLRREAEFLEYRERVRARLKQLKQLSKDPYYDRYLEQMMKDLESGVATPAQVEREARYSYDKYRQRMGQIVPQVRLNEDSVSKIEKKPGGNTEFKIGTHVFSFIGVIFVLIAFVIFSFHFLGNLEQEFYLCGAAFVLIAAIAAVFISRKKDSVLIRLISLAGCYVCFLPIQGLGTELRFLIITLMLFIFSIINIFLQNPKNQILINSLHLFFHLIFMVIMISEAWAEQIGAVYLALNVTASFILINVLALKICRERKTVLFPLCCIGNGICLFMLLLIGNLGPGINGDPDVALFVHLTTEAVIIAVCSVIFLLWGKEDGRRWAQLYYCVGILLLLGTFSGYRGETVLSVLLAVFVVKLASGQKEVLVLDCIVVIWTGMLGIWMTDFGILFAGMLFLSAFKIRQMYLFQEILVTVGISLIWWNWCSAYLYKETDMNIGWFYPIGAGMLLLLFLLFNFLPWLKDKNQQPYNITNIIFMTLYYLGVWQCNDYRFSTVMMILGTVTILIIFRERFRLAIPKKYLLLAGFLAYSVLTGHYEYPVLVSVFLMIIALGCVGIGFKVKDKEQRICGLAMAVFVCLKLVLYDLMEMEVVYRVVVFFVIGIMALIISLLYVWLGKNRRQDIEETVNGQIKEINNER